MFLGTAATLVAASNAFIAPMAVRSAAPASSSSSLKMQSAGAAYVETLPGAPFSDGKVRGIRLLVTTFLVRRETAVQLIRYASAVFDFLAGDACSGSSATC